MPKNFGMGIIFHCDNTHIQFGYVFLSIYFHAPPPSLPKSTGWKILYHGKTVFQFYIILYHIIFAAVRPPAHSGYGRSCLPVCVLTLYKFVVIREYFGSSCTPLNPKKVPTYTIGSFCTFLLLVLTINS
jgi:hypothetical protein